MNYALRETINFARNKAALARDDDSVRQWLDLLRQLEAIDHPVLIWADRVLWAVSGAAALVIGLTLGGVF